MRGLLWLVRAGTGGEVGQARAREEEALLMGAELVMALSVSLPPPLLLLVRAIPSKGLFPPVAVLAKKSHTPSTT